MDDSDFDAILAGTDAAAADDAATASEEPAPELPPSDVPDADPAQTSPETPVVAADSAPVVAEAPVAAAPAPVAPVKPTWDSPENPYAAEAIQHRQLKAALAEAQRATAQREAARQITDLADGDPERQAQLVKVLSNVATPLVQQNQQLSRDTEQAMKIATAMHLAMRATLSDDQIKAVAEEMAPIMALNGVEAMEGAVLGKTATRQHYQTQLSAKDSRIAELEAQVAARNDLANRRVNGADVVDTGVGAGVGGNPADAGTIDDYFERLWG